jgi:HEAT repeat protein
MKTFADVLNKIANEDRLHTASLYIFSKMDPSTLDVFRSVWPTIADQRRRDIMQELVELAEVNFEVDFDPVFLLALGDEDAEVRAYAINGLWENQNPALIGPLLHLLHTDETALVRAAAATALGQFLYLSEIEELEPETVAPIKEALLTTIHLPAEDIDVRRRAVEAIAFLSEPGITQLIEAAYYDDNPKMQISAIFAMGRNADKRWLPRVLTELDNDDTEICFEAARACGELEASEAVPKLISLVKNRGTDLEVQEMAIWALGRIGGEAARVTLERCLSSKIETIAQAADDALEELTLFSDTFDMFDFDEEDFEDDEDLFANEENDDEIDDYLN